MFGNPPTGPNRTLGVAAYGPILVRSIAQSAFILVGVLSLLLPSLGAPLGGSAREVAAPETTLASSTPSPFWIANDKGQVWNFGSVNQYGDLTGINLNRPIIGMAPTNDLKGYWLVAGDGGIFAFGNAPFYGSTGNIRLNKPIVGMAQTKSNKGYWMVATDGGIFSYGDARFHGSTGSLKLNKPIVAMASTPSGNGYWLVASDGGIFSFGDAQFFGSTGSLRLQKPIVAMTPTPSGNGYWLVASDGGIFSFGDAQFFGSAGGTSDSSFARIVPASDGLGYWLIRNGGDALAYGSATKAGAVRPAVGILFNITGPQDIAVLWSLQQLGKPYAWGGAGPATFDCSGLTQQAWLHAGARLPRVANDQYQFGGQILPYSQVRTGDLVFWGTDINNPRSVYHVGIYFGGGKVVMAPKPGDVVRIATVWQQDLMPNVVRPR